MNDQNQSKVEEAEIVTNQSQSTTVEVPLENTTGSTESFVSDSAEEHNPQVENEEVEIPVPGEGTVDQPEPSVDTPPETNEAPASPINPDIYTVRSEETGDKVYAVRQERRYWVKNPETLSKMGFYVGKEKKIPFSELLQFPEGEPIDLTVPDAVYPWDRPEGEKLEANKPSGVWN